MTKSTDDKLKGRALAPSTAGDIGKARYRHRQAKIRGTMRRIGRGGPILRG